MASKAAVDGARPDADWYWRGIRLRNYRSPMIQVALVGFIAFMTVGMSSALGGAGGGGLLNTKQSTNANVAAFAALAFFSGTIYNRVGIRVCLSFGGFGYALLSAAYMATAHLEDKATPFIVVAGCVEGLSAAMLWTAQGAVTMSYPTEDQKGRAFSTFWTIFQMAANWNSTAGTLSDGTYIAFIVIMLTGSFVLPFFLLPSDKVVRSDGSHVVLPEMPTWKSEIIGLVNVLFEDKCIITLFPFFIASNWFYTYQKNDFNVPNFTLRTRSFNGLFSNLFNMVGVWAMGSALDYKPGKFARKIRARIGIVVLLIVTLAIWGGGWAMVKDFERGVSPVPLIDVTESKRYAPYVIMYIFWAMYDGVFQAYAYWLMGSLSNNSRRLSHYAGWYKSLQSAGAAIVWRLDGLEISYKSMYLSTWMIMVFAVMTAFYVAFSKVQEHCNDEPQMTAARPKGPDLKASSTTSKEGKGMEVDVTVLPARS
ncbi:hypothetical protein HDZ31DRAFT_80486 [Schizophyllum fasciatum]